MAGKRDVQQLSQRALNRSLLARQMLLERGDAAPFDVVRHLCGMQAQSPQAPYVGLWTRLRDFRGEVLSDLIEKRKVVRIAVMRGTVHLVTADDARNFRALVQPGLTRVLAATSFGKDTRGVDMDALVAAGRAALKAKPLTLAELRPILAPSFPGYDGAALARALHYSAPLVQVPPRGLWRQGGAARVATAEAWLGKPLPKKPAADAMVLRYLAAFGPASVADAQAWSGLTRLAPIFEKLRPKLAVFRDESGRELLDLPDAPRPGEDVVAPARFLPEYDNLTLAHADRSRVVVAGPKTPVAQNLTVRGFLVDGMVAGFWKVAAEKGRATLTIEPFGRILKADMGALEAEGHRLMAFLHPEVDKRSVRTGLAR